MMKNYSAPYFSEKLTIALIENQTILVEFLPAER